MTIDLTLPLHSRGPRRLDHLLEPSGCGVGSIKKVLHSKIQESSALDQAGMRDGMGWQLREPTGRPSHPYAQPSALLSVRKGPLHQ